MYIENPIALRFIMQDELYLLNSDKVLYDAPAAPHPIAETLAVSFNYLGGNKKKFLVVTHYPDQEFIPDKHLAALENILKRLDFSLDDAAIFNIARHSGLAFEHLNNFFKPQKLLLLGANTLPEGMEAPAFNKTAALNNCSTLFSFSFDEMMENNENKKVFWEQMKQL